MEDIKNFKLIRYYTSNGTELTPEERHKLGYDGNCWWSLEERAYNAAYDISNDWAKEAPEWSDVEEGFRRGVKEGIEYCNDMLEKFKEEIKNNPLIADPLLALIEKHLKFGK